MIETVTGMNTIEDEPFDFHVTKKAPAVPTANDLMKIVQPKTDVRVRPYHEDSDECIVKNVGEETSASVPRVNWDDMFDCDLLSEAATNAKLIIQKSSTRTNDSKISDIARTDTTRDNIAECKDDKHPNKVEDKVTHDKKGKRKNQAKVTDAIPKKVKKVNEADKPNIRKQKYTMAVKNWLNDVDPNNLVLESETLSSIEPVIGKDDILCTMVNDIQPKINKNENVVIKKIKLKPTNKRCVVQAQLANKDGIMKFDKPKGKQETVVSSSKMENTKTDKAKEKKVKVKFLAPIKSQIPVKEVDYKVLTVDDTNIQDYSSLRHIENTDVVVVLIHR